MKVFRSLVLCLLVIAPLAGRAAPSEAPSITPNFKNASIRQIIQAVSAATGKNFILDPRVNAQVTMYSSTPLTPAAFYQAFLSILQVYGYIAVPSGHDVVQIVPDAKERQMPSILLPKEVSSTSDELVTQVIPVKNVSAAELVPILRPLVPEWGHLAAYSPSNILIISDRASNVYRIMHIVERIDRVGNQDVDVMPLQNASATQVVQVIDQLYQGQAAAQMGRTFKVVADARTNSVLISGDPAERLRIRALVAQLDTPSASGGDTRVVYLHYASAKKLAPKLKEQMQELAQIASNANVKGTAQVAAEKNALVWADDQNNALVITAPPKTMRTILHIVEQLDIRRPQVLVQAIIAEVDVNKTDDLGVNWAAYSQVDKLPLGGFVEPVGGTSIVDLVAAARNPTSLTTSLLEGTTLGIGTVSAGGISFAAMLRALRGNQATNIVATPSAVTMDNQQAVLKSVDEVPFVTGQYTNASTVTSGTVTPFQTVQREEVGTILKVTPTISATGDSVMLKISVESSSVLPTSVSSIDPTTQKRSITTNVLIQNKGIVVLGGLIENSQDRNHNSIPYLGGIPVLGWLFKARNDTASRSNLMIFIKPSILRDQNDAAAQSGASYRYMLEQEGALPRGQFPPLLRGEPRPTLPALPGAAAQGPGSAPPPGGAAPSTSPPHP
ncbi:MAG: type II secretion system secretin GspD [Steroidobacteraceae bacterium]